MMLCSRSESYLSLPATTFAAVLCLAVFAAHGQSPTFDTTSPSISSAYAGEEASSRLAWENLTAAQRAALWPLEHDWPSIDVQEKQQWRQLAERFPSMSARKRARTQSRMARWTRLTPRQRGQARLRFQEAQQVAPKDRRDSWEAYRALPAKQRRRLTVRARRAEMAGNLQGPHPAARDQGRRQSHVLAREAPVKVKSNTVPNPSQAAQPRPVAPTVIQAQPGATTMLMSNRPAPPVHQHTGMPKIAATPEFVDPTTLLPRRGAQGAAIQQRSASTPARRRRR